MKKLLLTFGFALYFLFSWAQAPEIINYQAIIRNSDNELVINSEIGIEISLVKDSENGTIVYTETQQPTSNTNGLISIEIGGSEANVTAGDFSSIDWSGGKHYIKTKIDPTGGMNYTIEGTVQLLSVPYALHSKTAESLTTPFVEVDGSVTNEIQDLQLIVDILTITNNAIATQIDLSKYIDEINVDTINIIAGNGVTISGTYPDITISATHALTQHYIGELMGTDGEDGVVFWVDHTGQHGLICSPENLNGGADWSDETGEVVPDGAMSRFDGYANTIAINNQSANSAAGTCLSYSTPGTNAGDWYLPAIDELSKIYHVQYEINKALNTSSFNSPYYWSSTELRFNYAWYF